MEREQLSTLAQCCAEVDSESISYLEALFYQYSKNPSSVAVEWQTVFKSLQQEGVMQSNPSPSWVQKGWPVLSRSERVSALDGQWPEVEKSKAPIKGQAKSYDQGQSQVRFTMAVLKLIETYRKKGHLISKINPLRHDLGVDPEVFSLEAFNLAESDLSTPIAEGCEQRFVGMTLRQLVDHMRETYCGTSAYEFAHVNDEESDWLYQHVERSPWSPTSSERTQIVEQLICAEGLEKFLETKFFGIKRFGLDGGEALLPALRYLIECGKGESINDVVIGMAHRGRLNVLTNLLDKPYDQLFAEFKGKSVHDEEVNYSGDVKYHMGYCTNLVWDDGTATRLEMAYNPSHLESVDPVVLGNVRARQDLIVDSSNKVSVLPVLIHGEAAFAGQGVVSECFSLFALNGYSTRGSIHIIINNQIGFTTDPKDGRSTYYASDLAKGYGIPILHCNGDDPEAVLNCIQLALHYRQKFLKPIVIDMLCYRRNGHNEGDEPFFTQPLLYKTIKAHASVLTLYGQSLEQLGVMTRGELDQRISAFRDQLDIAFQNAGAERQKGLSSRAENEPSTVQEGNSIAVGLSTGISGDAFNHVAQLLTQLPEGFSLHRTLQRMMEQKKNMLHSGQGIDWATAEALAFGSLLLQGNSVRLSGQDVCRGTFSHRHAVLFDQNTGEAFSPLAQIQHTQTPRWSVFNSLLSEEAVLGFEYGYSLYDRKSLVLWEAQFGDFANGAQVIFDQYISSGETKWKKCSGLTVLLPHGYEGQGPEHSSARLERFLQLCAQDNMYVINSTRPSNYFHALRRQLMDQRQRPLIVMAPKSLLRHRLATSERNEFLGDSTFHPVLFENNTQDSTGVETKKRLILCSGKVYYDLLEHKTKESYEDCAIVRLEQLYPFPREALAQLFKRCKCTKVVWCQEEPENMGAWTFVRPYLLEILQQFKNKPRELCYAGRPASASTAVGTMKRHVDELEAFLTAAFRV